MKLASEVRFFDDSLKRTFEALEQGSYEEKQLFKWFERAFQDIQENAFCGIQVPKKQIPKEYFK